MEEKLVTGYLTGRKRKDGRIAVTLICGHITLVPITNSEKVIRVPCPKC